ncbi:MAG TPA: PQ-loop domain-containing transporter [Candidatus Saccharimonadales bacterium]|nr:PQ-loop domain-containing transporter [Candidatus Saccharimonadales bacterium]
MDFFIWLFSVATPLFEIPQAYTIYVNHSSQNVSIYTWGFFLIDNVVWLVYAIRKDSKPLLITSILYFLIELSIVIGIFKYSYLS